MGTIGGALCAAEPRFDMLTLVTGVGARLEVLSADGVRLLTPAEFFRPDGGTRLQPGEILTAVRFPGAAAYDAVAFEKFRQRTFDAALASVLCAVRTTADGVLADLRIAVGATTPVPVAATGACAPLIGTAAGDLDPGALAGRVVEEVLGDRGDRPAVRYSRELVPALVRRALGRALPNTRS
jgi:carbon-monoxide dehydrogenase medium subunit